MRLPLNVDRWRPTIKIVLDITRLVQEGKLTRDEAERLKTLASQDTSTLAINALMVFGAAAVSAGILALNPSFAAGAALGVAFVLVGLAVTFRSSEQWSLLGTATTIIGALLLAGGVVGLLEGAFIGTCFTAALLLALAVLIRSSFLMALVPLAVAAALGSSTGYTHATYMLIVSEPAITIVVFSLLAAAAYFVSQQAARPMRGWRWSLPACRCSSSISGSGSARYGATTRAKAGYTAVPLPLPQIGRPGAPRRGISRIMCSSSDGRCCSSPSGSGAFA